MRLVDRFKIFHKTGNRKILAQPNGPQNGGNLQGPYFDIPEKFKDNRMWKLKSIAILTKAYKKSKICMAPSSEDIYENFS